MTAPVTAEVDGRAVHLVPWGWDCIDCEGSFGVNDRCADCGGTNRIRLYAIREDADRFEAAQT